MSEELPNIHDLAKGGSVLVFMVPTDQVGELFGGGNATQKPAHRKDPTIAEYRAQYEPDVSESRIREWCQKGVFPDTKDESGETIPGAYKDTTGAWRITLEGIQARQARERREGLKRRRFDELTVDHVSSGDEYVREEESEDDESSGRSEGSISGDPKSANRKTVQRPRKGKWQDALA